MTTQVDVSIIIVNYNSSALVEACVKSIYNLTKRVSYEIIILDNNSEPAIVDKFADFPDCRVVCLSKNVGFGRANNEGFKLAEGRYFFCLNPDTFLLNDAISLLVDFMDKNPEVGACGGNLYSIGMQENFSFRRMLPGLIWELNEFFNLKPECVLYKKNRIFNNTGRPLKVGYITGADLLLRRSVIEKTHGFNPNFFMYYEETDLCRKIVNAGYEIYSVPEAKICHLESATFSTPGPINKNKIERCEEGRRIFYQLNANWCKRVILNSVYLMTLVTRALFLPPSSKRSSWRHRLKVFFKH